jgi:UDP-3-O-[3-hydroxymyristoyl] N-acetylglucosamine deacetylase
MPRAQRTLKKEVSFSGIGLHSGKEVTCHFLPAKEDTGIVFQRIDLPGKPLIAATIENVCETTRSTTIGKGKVIVQTVEHLLAALYACNVDNVCIQITAGEVPISDGSSIEFVKLIEEAEVVEQQSFINVKKINAPVVFSKGETHLVAIPSDEFSISCTLHYPKSPLISSQYFSLKITEESFKQELAPCRTFALYDEIALLKEKGLIQGGSLENGIVIKGAEILCKGGLRFSDEPVRHKILDLVGDIALVGFHFNAHIIAIRSGHAANVGLGKEIVNNITTFAHEFSQCVGAR